MHYPTRKFKDANWRGSLWHKCQPQIGFKVEQSRFAMRKEIELLFRFNTKLD